MPPLGCCVGFGLPPLCCWRGPPLFCCPPSLCASLRGGCFACGCGRLSAPFRPACAFRAVCPPLIPSSPFVRVLAAAPHCVGAAVAFPRIGCRSPPCSVWLCFLPCGLLLRVPSSGPAALPLESLVDPLSALTCVRVVLALAALLAGYCLHCEAVLPFIAGFWPVRPRPCLRVLSRLPAAPVVSHWLWVPVSSLLGRRFPRFSGASRPSVAGSLPARFLWVLQALASRSPFVSILGCGFLLLLVLCPWFAGSFFSPLSYGGSVHLAGGFPRRVCSLPGYCPLFFFWPPLFRAVLFLFWLVDCPFFSVVSFGRLTLDASLVAGFFLCWSSAFCPGPPWSSRLLWPVRPHLRFPSFFALWRHPLAAPTGP